MPAPPRVSRCPGPVPITVAGAPDEPRRRERGATVVEYALGISLVALALAVGIQVLEGAARDDLEGRAAVAGAPDLGPGSSLPTTTAAPTTAAPSEPPTTSAPQHVAGASLHGTQVKDGPDWVATVVVTVTDQASGVPLAGVDVTADWSEGVGSGTSCLTGTNGTCSISTAEINRRGNGSIPSVTLTVVSLSGEGITAGGALPQITVNAP